MPEPVRAISSRVLQWARERSGLSVEAAAARMRRSTEELLAWETGTAAPTFAQLERLATAYKRPIAVFFFPDPPDEPDVVSEFRTLPQDEIEDLEPDTRLALREAYAWQESIRELTGGHNRSDTQIVKDLTVRVDEPAERMARRVREYLGVPLDEQRRWSSATEAFKQWRTAVEAVGVFVFKRSFEQRTISGFCLHDREFPVIMVNNSTAHARQAFTLFHELAHLLFHVSSVTYGDGDAVDRYSHEAQQIEIACNRFAGEVLVPSETFPWQRFTNIDLLGAVEIAAREYSVSREVILRKLLDRGIVDAATYARSTEQWNQEYEEGRRLQKPGGDYYATQAAYLGDNYLNLAFGEYHAGRVSLPELSAHLGMKVKSISRLEDFLTMRRAG